MPIWMRCSPESRAGILTSTAAARAAMMTGGDVDLDALLAGIDCDDSDGGDAGGGTGDDELDALLAGFDDDTGEADADGGEEEMDPELAALLADL